MLVVANSGVVNMQAARGAKIGRLLQLGNGDYIEKHSLTGEPLNRKTFVYVFTKENDGAFEL